MIYPKPYSIYLRGTINTVSLSFRNPKLPTALSFRHGVDSDSRVRGLGLRV